MTSFELIEKLQGMSYDEWMIVYDEVGSAFKLDDDNILMVMNYIRDCSKIIPDLAKAKEKYDLANRNNPEEWYRDVIEKRARAEAEKKLLNGDNCGKGANGKIKHFFKRFGAVILRSVITSIICSLLIWWLKKM